MTSGGFVSGEGLDLGCGGGTLTRFFEAVVEIADRGRQGLGQLPQASRRDAVGAALVFLNLLEANPDLNGQLLLGQAQQATTTTQATTQVKIDIGGHDGPSL